MVNWRRVTFLAFLFYFIYTAATEGQEKKGTQLVIDRIPENTLSFFYENLKVEFPFCAYGTDTGGTIHIENISFPIIYKKTEEYFERGGCYPDGLLGYGHSHPPPWDSCSLSIVDEETFLWEEEKYIFLICRGKKRFYWWSRPAVERDLARRAKASPPKK